MSKTYVYHILCLHRNLFTYHMDSNIAVRNVVFVFTAVSHADVQPDAHVGASAYDDKYIQYDDGPVS